ncbi:hypothetical protein ACFOGG_07470 [Brenneria rubrifaciens]
MRLLFSRPVGVFCSGATGRKLITVSHPIWQLEQNITFSREQGKLA